MSLLVVRNVRKSFASTDVLRGVDLDCQDQQKLCLLGKSGSGKTTLLRVLAGLEKADDGTITIAGRPLHSYAANTFPVSLLFQKPAVYPHMTVRENIEFPLIARRVGHNRLVERLKTVSELVGVS